MAARDFFFLARHRPSYRIIDLRVRMLRYIRQGLHILPSSRGHAWMLPLDAPHWARTGRASFASLPNKCFNVTH
jgi:hypothetical protein